MKKIFFCFLLYIFPGICFSQNNAKSGNTLDLFEDSLIHLQNRIFKLKDDSAKLLLNKVFFTTLKDALNTDKSFDYAFDSLTFMAKLESPDKRFRIFNWNMAISDGTFAYFGIIQSHNTKTKKYEVFPLVNKSREIKNQKNATTDNNKWLGMLYYQIIEKNYRKKTYYTLLAWDGNDKITSKKIIDVLYFGSNGVPKFGDPIFEMGKFNQKRVIFEYASSVVMSLKYNEQNDMIVFDHLIPKESSLEGQYQFYGPDLSYDGFEFKKGKWIYIKDVDARNRQNKSEKLYTKPDSRQKNKAKQLYNPSGNK